MEVRHPIVLTGGAGSPTRAGALGEREPLTQPAQGGKFSALFKDLAQNMPDEKASSPSESHHPAEPTPSSDVGKQETIASVMGVALVSNSAVQDPQVASVAEADSGTSAQNAQGFSPQGSEPIPSVLPIVRVQTHEAGATGQDPVATGAALPTTTDLPSHPVLQPPVDPAQSGEMPVLAPKQTISGTTGEAPIRNGRDAVINLAPVPLEQPSGHSALLSTPPLDSLISSQLSSPVVGNQEKTNLLLAASVNGGAHPLTRPSTEIQSSEIGSAQGSQGATLSGQSLSTTMMGDSGGGQEHSSGADRQGQGEGTLFHSRTSRAPDSLVRDNQSPLFIDQFTSARQIQSSPQAEGSSAVTATADHLKITQAFFGGDHPATMTSASGMAQSVHVELPSHDSGPLSVRISMTDQMVHTQFTTDRSDLGHILLTRQDQLQQDLTRAGLELGQFQVHIDHHGQQEGPPEWQSRQQGEAREDTRPRHQAEPQEQEKKGQEARSTQALSVFA